MKKENIFDLYEQQNRKQAQPKPERLPEEVAPEEIEPEEVTPEPDNAEPEPAPEAQPEKPEEGEDNGV